MKVIFTLLTHTGAVALGFALGIYFLPLLTETKGADTQTLQVAMSEAQFKGVFRRDLPGSDFLHWGEGEIAVGKAQIALKGELAPGPDYKLYLAPSFVDDEASFLTVKADSVVVGNVTAFSDFVVDVPEGVDPQNFNTVVVWCEAFGEFISSARYQPI